MIARVTVAAMVVAVGSLAFAYGSSGLWVGAAALAATGTLWLVGWWRRWRTRTTLALVLCITLVAVGATLRLQPWLLLTGLVASLAAWDLEYLTVRLWHVRSNEDTPEIRALQRWHLVRLGAVSAVGMAMAVTATVVRVHIGLGVAVLLGVLAIFGLNRVVIYLRRESD